MIEQELPKNHDESRRLLSDLLPNSTEFLPRLCYSTGCSCSYDHRTTAPRPSTPCRGTNTKMDHNSAQYKRLSVWTVAQSVVAASLMSQPSVSKERTNLSPQEPTCQTQLLIESAIFSEHHDTEQIVDRFRDCNSRAHPRGWKK